MSEIETVTVENPKKPGKTQIIDKEKYNADPKAYKLVKRKPPSPPAKPAEKSE